MYGYNCMICFMKRKVNHKNCLFQNKMGRKEMDRHIDEHTGWGETGHKTCFIVFAILVWGFFSYVAISVLYKFVSFAHENTDAYKRHLWLSSFTEKESIHLAVSWQ